MPDDCNYRSMTQGHPDYGEDWGDPRVTGGPLRRAWRKFWRWFSYGH